MMRTSWLGWISLGTLTVCSFFGCYGSFGSQPGACEDDGNPCTVDSCDIAGKPSHVPVPDAEQVACFLGENDGVCQTGTCELNCTKDMTPCKCSSKTDCPVDSICATWECTMGQCVSTSMMEGMTADPLMPGDCLKKICQGGALKIVDDPMDTPTDIKGDCQDPVCNAGVPETMANDNDVPAMDAVPGDCKKPVCNGGMLGLTPDTMDAPPADECITYSCTAAGDVTPANAPVGTKCGPNMAMTCDKFGMCVACLPAGKDDYDKCKMNNGGSCPVKLCLGEGASSAGDCQSQFIADGVCCENACTGECKGCTVPGMVGKCTNVPTYIEDDQYGAGLACTIAISGSVCNGAGKCLRIVGTSCTMDTQCYSAKCMNSKCLGATGEICGIGGECLSGTCMMGVCK